jgi:hypothetical protein
VKLLKNNEDSTEKVHFFSKVQNLFNILVIKVEKKEKKIFKILGWIILGSCIYYWVHFFFIVQQYEPLLYSTYFVLILMGLTFINEFKSTFLNSITCLTWYGFFNETIAMSFQVNNLFSLVVGPLLHGTIGLLQLYMILHRKIPICKRYLIWGVLFYFIFVSSYDSFQRWKVIIGLETIISNNFAKAYTFYTILFSAVGIYFYKKKYGILIEN